MSPVCYRKNKECGLWFEIKTLEKLIASPTAPQKEKEFAKKKLRSWKKVLGDDYQKALSSFEASKSGRF